MPPLTAGVRKGHTGFSSERIFHQQVKVEPVRPERPKTEGSLYFLKVESQKKNFKHSHKHQTGAIRDAGVQEFLYIRGRPENPGIYRSEMKERFTVQPFHVKMAGL